MFKIKFDMQSFIFYIFVSFLVIVLIVALYEILFHVPIRDHNKQKNLKRTSAIYKIDFVHNPEYQITPYYMDLDIGDVIQVKRNSDVSNIRVVEIKAESRNYYRPRTKVTLDVDGYEHFAYCGMIDASQGGIGPIEVNGIKIGVEITKLVFSRTSKIRSFNSYQSFNLLKDVRLAIWDGSQPILRNGLGLFIIEQPEWTLNKYGNWLHKTKYGLHSAIDIYATNHGISEKVISPVDGISFGYNKETPPDSETLMKHVNVYSDDVVGPDGEKILFRFLHLSKILVSNGEHVKKGQIIGLTGHTGFKESIGDHLHFEIRLNPSHFGQKFNNDILASIPVNSYYYLLEWWENRVNRKDNE
ncbi:MAG: M23 family metallopeptidase [bacterium]|nr:MAG: M23 family metallopeptidase [bacterium]